MRFLRMADKKGQGGKSNRGFASMDEDKQREIASKGGQSVPPEKRSFSQDPDLAAEAGRQGGESVPDEKRSISQDRELASEAGRKSGESSGGSGESTSGSLCAAGVGGPSASAGRLWGWIAACYAELGRGREARSAALQFCKGAGVEHASLSGSDADVWRIYWRRRFPAKNPADLERLFAGLRKAGLPV
jgi:general stress protein YciG